jgi:RTX calcium-binding nonapeptide repeat (4 copies)
LSSGAGADFLWGMGGNDTLDGGDGIDTAGYYAAYANNFKIRQQGNDQVLTQIAGTDRAGEDTLRNIEKVRFGNKLYEIKKGKDVVILIELSALGDDLTRLSSMILNAVSDSGKIISDTRVKIAAYGQNGLVQSEFFQDLNLATSKKALQLFVNGLGSSSQPDTTIRYDDQQLLNVLSSNSSLWRSDVDKKIIAISAHDNVYGPPEVQLTDQIQLAAANSGVGIDRLVYAPGAYDFLNPYTGFDYNNTAGAVMLYKHYSDPENPGGLNQLINASFNRPEIQAEISLTNVSVDYNSFSAGAVLSDFLLTGGAVTSGSNLTYEISGIGGGEYISIYNNKLVVRDNFTPSDSPNPVIRYASSRNDFIVAVSISSLPVTIYDKVSFEITNIPVYYDYIT